jgi:hypothetical protein
VLPSGAGKIGIPIHSMDRDRQAHLLIKATVDQEIARLEFERRCALPTGGSNDAGWNPAGAIFYGADG